MKHTLPRAWLVVIALVAGIVSYLAWSGRIDWLRSARTHSSDASTARKRSQGRSRAQISSRTAERRTLPEVDPAIEPHDADADGRPGDDAPASDWIAAAIRSLESHETVSARLRYRVHIEGQELSGSGSYLQGPWRYRMLRLDLKLQLEDGVSQLLQVSDGHDLWIMRQLSGKQALGRIDVDRVLEAQRKAGGVAAGASPTDYLGMGGLPRLLRGIGYMFTFTAQRDSTITGIPVHVITGRWTDGMLRYMLPAESEEQKNLPPDPRQLLPNVPDQVVLHLGHEDLFPYRVEYQRSSAAQPDNSKSKGSSPADADKQGRGGGSATAQRSPQTMVALEFYEVRLNAPIDSFEFGYNPGALEPVDVTNTYLTSLGLPVE